MEISTEFILIGEDEDDAEDLSSAEPGRIAVIHQGLYEQGEEEWSKGDRVGTLHGNVIVGRLRKVVCHLVFDFDGEHTLVATGALPGGLSNFDGGTIAVTGGSGEFAKAAGICVVETMNPKRYNLFL